MIRASRVLLTWLLFMMFALPCAAEDKVAPVFDQIDDILTRVESGISLNSYAESLAQLKIEYKKAASDPDAVYNPLLTDRMKKVLQYMDSYAQVWRVAEIDGYKAVRTPPAIISQNRCRVDTRYNGTFYEIDCLKSEIMLKLRDNISNAKSAHFNGW